jgi:arylformamidase
MPAALYRHFQTQAEIDAAYNPSLQVADAAAELRHFAEAAQRARATLRHQLDLPYGATLAETLDIFPADPSAQGSGPGAAPVFVFLHGGYWRALSSRDFSGIALGLQRRGITTVLVNYALCPQVTIDEIVRQVRAALAWVLRHIGAHGGDAQRVAIGGHSAGGHLTAMALLTRWAEDYGLPADPFRAALAISGLYDLNPLRYSYLQPMIQLDEGVIRRQSPAFLASTRRSTTPLWLTWGGDESDEFAHQSRLMHDAWQAAGNPGVLSVQAGRNHFSALHGFEDPASPLCDWLAHHLSTGG